MIRHSVKTTIALSITAVLIIMSAGCSEMSQVMNGEEEMYTVRSVPPIDKNVPARLETATFALG